MGDLATLVALALSAGLATVCISHAVPTIRETRRMRANRKAPAAAGEEGRS